MKLHVTMILGFALLVGFEAARGDEGADQARLRAVLEKGISAHGGRDKLAKLKAYRIRIRGSAEVNGATVRFTAESVIQLPAQYRVKVQVGDENEPLLRVINGDKAWQRVGGQTEELKDEQLAEIRAGMHLIYVRSLLPLLNGKAYRLSPLGEIQISDRPVVGIKVTKKGEKDIDLYFDKVNGLLVKSMRWGVGFNQKEINLETFYRDFKEIDGLRQPMTFLLHHDGKSYMRQEVTDLQFVDRLDDDEFAKP
jgi:hypothetical protein